MNIIEAIKSRKRFRRPSDGQGIFYSHTDWYTLHRSIILADDFELEEKKSEITKDMLLKIFRHSSELNGCEFYRPDYICNILISKLDLE